MKALFCILFSLVAFFLCSSVIYAKEVTIEMTQDGFKPAQVEVDQGDSVIFINKDTTAHWPASDIHPTHTIYPEFDSLKGVAPLTTWQFQPQITGSFKFHDHLFPHKKGTLVVKQVPGFISSSQPNLPVKNDSLITQVIDSIKHFFSNIASFFRPKTTNITAEQFKSLDEKSQLSTIDQMIDNQGLEKTWQFILNSYRTDSTRNAHDLAHYIGGEIYKHQGIEGIGICTADFAFGCFHGFTEIASLQGVDKLVQVADSCLKVGAKNSGSYISCVHGVGHGVATFYQTQQLDQALTTCDNLEATTQAPYCYDGVFMEFALNAPTTFYTKDENKLYPCHQVETKHQIACARYIPVVASRVHKLDFLQTANLCLQSTIEDIKLHCFDALGFEAASRSNSEPQQVINLCQQISDPKYKSQCLGAAAGEYVFQKVPNWQTKSIAICNSLTMPEYKTSCLERVERIKQSYDI